MAFVSCRKRQSELIKRSWSIDVKRSGSAESLRSNAGSPDCSDRESMWRGRKGSNESSMSCYQMPYVSNGFKWRIDGYASSCFDFLVKNVCNVRVGLALWCWAPKSLQVVLVRTPPNGSTGKPPWKSVSSIRRTPDHMIHMVVMENYCLLPGEMR